MKIRNGFVSNSSSSSFLIYGVELSNKKDDLIKKFGLEEGADLYEIGEVLEKQTGLEYHIPPDSDALYVGKSWSTVKDDETGLQFKQGVEKIIKDALGVDTKCGTCSEAWYDG